MLPKDPVILLSFVNMNLRDKYKNLDLLCDDLDIDKTFITDTLKLINYEYDEKINQFK